MNTVTDTTRHGEYLLAASQVTRLVRQRAELSELRFQRLRFRLGLQRWKITGSLEVRGAMKAAP